MTPSKCRLANAAGVRKLGAQGKALGQESLYHQRTLKEFANS